YLVSKLDAGKMARFKNDGARREEELEDHVGEEVVGMGSRRERKWLSLRNEELWTTLVSGEW
ncbi:MAG TPA: hypothetical protein VNB49_01495, partial [Candidatus Dormibacteraeota bacterium]|nr:hypothetical protein [Candidatus Dormibacteraeota bacterium]